MYIISMLPLRLLPIATRLGLLGLSRAPLRKRIAFLEESHDPWLRRGLLTHALTEIVSSGPGGGLLLSAALRFGSRNGLPVALIDGTDSFDPKSALAGPAPSLLWVRCHLSRELLFASDLLLRDGSFPLVWIDLFRLPSRELRRIPPTTWHRFGRLVERRGTAALLLTPFPLIPAVRERYRVEASLSLACLEEPREALWQRLRLVPLRLSGSENREAPALLPAAG